MDLIILTTAITRGQFHRKSLGKFYNLYQTIFKKDFANIHHIINLDYPDKLKDKYSKEETIDLFKEIIPDFINIEIIDNNTIGFLNAYKNVVSKTHELNLLHNNCLIWWLEDDWDVVHFNENLFNIIKIFPLHIPIGFNSVRSSPLGSFRGGPIMTNSYFCKYFDIVSNHQANDTCDPEKQVNRWISGIDKMNGKKKIKRDIENDKDINIIYFFMKTNKIKVTEIPKNYYNNKNKFNSELNFNYHFIKSNDLKQYYYSNLNHNKIQFENRNINHILEIMNDKGINYICIKPWLLDDIGRQFNEENSLQKWSTINDGTSYI